MKILLLSVLAITVGLSTSRLSNSNDGSNSSVDLLVDKSHPYLSLAENSISEEHRLRKWLFDESREYDPKVPPPTLK